MKRIQRGKRFNYIFNLRAHGIARQPHNKPRGRLERILPSLYKYTTHAVFGFGCFFFPTAFRFLIDPNRP